MGAETAPRGRYAVALDPLDGASNILAGVTVGTIFGIMAVRPGPCIITSE